MLELLLEKAFWLVIFAGLELLIWLVIGIYMLFSRALTFGMKVWILIGIECVIVLVWLLFSS